MTADLARRFRRFAEVECQRDSPLYFRLGMAVADDAAILEWLAGAPSPQPNLFFAAARFLGAPYESYDAFRSFVVERLPDIAALMRTRRTQTNEVGRCATLLPALAALPGPLALIEVGTSAGLCLLADRYAYEYAIDGRRERLGAGPPRLTCEVRGRAPVPGRIPEVVWRAGLDIAPVDVTDDDAVAWLEACVWPDQPERLDRLRAAVRLARQDPPRVLRGDAIADLPALVEAAPADATLVVFHSAVLSYLDPGRRTEFAATVRRTRAVWLANEAPGIVMPSPVPTPPEACFLLSRGDEALALAHPHGRWLHWMSP